MGNTEDRAKTGGSMNAYIVSYDWAGSYQAYEWAKFVVVANTASEALGLAIQSRPDIDPEHAHGNWWSVEEISLASPEVFLVASRCS